MNPDDVYYRDYLQLKTVLNSQKPRSFDTSAPAHDEMLFVIVHQVYELWFKQILFEVQSVVTLFGEKPVPEYNVALSLHRLERVNRIYEVMLQQFIVIETMSAFDFMDFRDLLEPASGFQSAQFRVLEATLGLKDERRVNQKYLASLDQADRDRVVASHSATSLFDVVEKWLEDMPFMEDGSYLFWEEYKKCLVNLAEHDRKAIEKNSILSDEEKTQKYSQIAQHLERFESLFNEDAYNLSVSKGERRLSLKALRAALFIHLYREYPILHLPYRLLAELCTLDQNFTHWRYRHAEMVMKMIGARPGTGGSSGFEFLLQTMIRQRVFDEIASISGYLVQRRDVPKLPDELAKRLKFAYETQGK